MDSDNSQNSLSKWMEKLKLELNWRAICYVVQTTRFIIADSSHRNNLNSQIFSQKINPLIQYNTQLHFLPFTNARRMNQIISPLTATSIFQAHRDFSWPESSNINLVVFFLPLNLIHCSQLHECILAGHCVSARILRNIT